jgi:hypothetical protein
MRRSPIQINGSCCQGDPAFRTGVRTRTQLFYRNGGNSKTRRLPSV